MSALEEWRREARALLPGGFLRRAQGECLFVSDLPRHAADIENVLAALEQKGYRAKLRNGLLYIDGTAEKYRALAENAAFSPVPACETQNVYLSSLARRLLRHPAPPQLQPADALRLTLKLLDAGDEAGLERALPPLLAVFQRQKIPLPTAAGYLILRYLAEKEGNRC